MFGKRKQLGKSVSIDEIELSISVTVEIWAAYFLPGKMPLCIQERLPGIIATEGKDATGEYKNINVHCSGQPWNMKGKSSRKKAHIVLRPKILDFKGKKEEI